MARIRTIKPEFPQSESMGNVSRDARLCFIMLWTVSDDEGRLRANSRMLASVLFPYDTDAPALIDDWLKELETQNCIQRYEVDGHKYIEITNWKTGQKIDHPSVSRLPSPREPSRKIARVSRKFAQEGKGPRKGEDQGEDRKPNGFLLGRVPPEELAGTLPLVDGSEYEISKAQVHDWEKAYPALNIKQQLLAYKEWLKANPAKRKTRTGQCRSITFWLSGKQDKAGNPSLFGSPPQQEELPILRRPAERATG